MASLRTNSRIEVGSASWISEERASALQFADAEAEEFSFSARNELDWLNEHMAEIFSENQLYVNNVNLKFLADKMRIEMLQRYSRRQESYEGRLLELRVKQIHYKFEL